MAYSHIGKFEGYASTDEHNEHDPYAVAIYREDHIHLGFLPKGSVKMHDYIEEQGGVVHCYGYVACRGVDADTEEPSGFYAAVCVENDWVEVAERNKEYNTTDKYYIYEEGELKAFLEDRQRT